MQKLSSNIIIAPLTVKALWLLLLDVEIVCTENYYSSYYCQPLHSDLERMNVEHYYDLIVIIIIIIVICDTQIVHAPPTDCSMLVYLMDCLWWCGNKYWFKDRSQSNQIISILFSGDRLHLAHSHSHTRTHKFHSFRVLNRF